VRDGGVLREVSWERALQTAAGLARHRGRVGALVGGQATNEEGFLLARMLREGLGSGDIDSRSCDTVPLELTRALAAPALQATVTDLEYAHTILVVGCEPLDDAPILDLRIRKGVRRRGVQLIVASARPSALDVNARQVVRFGPGGEVAFLASLDRALGREGDDDAEGVGEDVAALAAQLRDGGEDIVIVWGERLGAGAASLLLSIADRLGLAGRQGAGLLEVPSTTNGRGLREAGVLPNAGPGYSEPAIAGRGAGEIARAAAAGEITALYLLQTDPMRDQPDGVLWEQAMEHASLVIAHASVLTEGLRAHASVLFPAESYAEKEGTVVHPDGRLQRLRTAIKRPGEVRAGWQVLAELARRVGHEARVLTAPIAFRQIVAAVPFYAGLTLEEIGGHGVRWPEREQAAAMPAGARAQDTRAPGAPRLAPAGPDTAPGATPQAASNALRVGTYRPIWAAPEVEVSPALKFAIARQQVELSPEDAQRLGITGGDEVVVAQNGTRLNALAHVRAGVREGTAFVAEALASDSANALTEPLVEVRKA
jgi:NADH-quinone oxidoreductase subunit G